MDYLQHPRVLLAEDNEGDIWLIRDLFREVDPNIRLQVTRNGDETLRYLRKEGEFNAEKSPDLLLLDLNLPLVNGRNILSELKKTEALKLIPVIILSSSSREEDVVECCENHCNAYVTKPNNIDQYKQVIQSIIDFWLHSCQIPSHPNSSD